MAEAITNRNLKGFLLKLSAFVAVVFLLDLCGGFVLKKYYFRQRFGYDYLTTYAIEKTRADILIFGSSRAVNIFDPAIFRNRLQLTCYNTGRYGEPVFYHYAVLKSVLKRYTPRIVLLSFDAGYFSKNPESYDRLSVLLPYYHQHPEIRPIVALKGPFEKLKLISHIYPYNSLILPIITGNTGLGKNKYATDSGFIALKHHFSGPLTTFDYTKEKDLDSNKIAVYKSFISDCAKSSIQLYIVCPPYHINQAGIDPSITLGEKIADEYHVKFLDYSTDSAFTGKPELFADYRHLNETGAALLTGDVINKISSSR